MQARPHARVHHPTRTHRSHQHQCEEHVGRRSRYHHQSSIVNGCVLFGANDAALVAQYSCSLCLATNLSTALRTRTLPSFGDAKNTRHPCKRYARSTHCFGVGACSQDVERTSVGVNTGSVYKCRHNTRRCCSGGMSAR